MLLSGMVWGYLIGVFCSMAAASPTVQAFRDEISALNTFMSAYNLNHQLRFRLREYMHETIHLRNTEARNTLLRRLSPAMQGEVSLLVNQRWVSKIWYLRQGTQLELLIDIASRLKPQVFPPWEFCPCGFMYIVNRGTALYAGRPQHEGSAWGEDILLNRMALQLDFEALAATYLWVFTIDAQQLLAAIDNFPQSAVRLWQIQKKWLIRRAVVRYAEEISWKNGKAFRGRLVPIYAKHIKRSIIMEKRVAEGSPTMVSINSSRITKRLSEAMIPTVSSITAATNEEGGEKTPNGAPPKSPFRRMLGGSSTPKTPKTPKKNQASSCSSIAQAAAQNFGLHMREQDLKAALKDEKVQKAQMAQLYKDVGQLQNDMNTVLKILKATHPELAHLDAKPTVVAEPLKDIGSKTPRDVELNRAPGSTEVDEEVEPIPGSACSKRASTASRRHSALEGKALQRARSGLSPTSNFTARSSEGVPVVVTATAVASTSSSASPDDLQVQVPPP